MKRPDLWSKTTGDGFADSRRTSWVLSQHWDNMWLKSEMGRCGMLWWKNWINLGFSFKASFLQSVKFSSSSYTHRCADFGYGTGKSPTVQEHSMPFLSLWIEHDLPASHASWRLDMSNYVDTLLCWISD